LNRHCAHLSGMTSARPGLAIRKASRIVGVLGDFPVEGFENGHVFPMRALQ
jgi:hypothetical protein